MAVLERYDGKNIRVTLTDGETVSGLADSFPSGYGLQEYGREEEGICVGDLALFRSQIQSIEVPEETGGTLPEKEELYDLMGNLLDGPWWVVDILPRRVPADPPGQYFAVEQYFLQKDRAEALYRRYAEILLKLNCYYDMAVSFDDCETWDMNPDPAALVTRITQAPFNIWMRAVFPAQNAMIDLDFGYTDLTLYDPEGNILDTCRALVQSEGLFLWEGEEV